MLVFKISDIQRRKLNIYIYFALSLLRQRIGQSYCYCNNWKSDNYIEREIYKTSHESLHVLKGNKILSKEVKSYNFWYRKVKRLIVICGAIEKSLNCNSALKLFLQII